MDFSLLGLWSQMGVVAKLVVIILLGMSGFAIWIAIDRLILFGKGRKGSMGTPARWRCGSTGKNNRWVRSWRARRRTARTMPNASSR